MMASNWGKMPYPKFLETEDVAVYEGKKPIWRGKCYFVYRGRFLVHRDGTQDEVNARMTTDQDLMKILRRHKAESLEFKAAGRVFGLVNFRPVYNPDGSFHHITFNLLERACGDEVCEEQGGDAGI